MDDAPEITVLQLPRFKADATELIGADDVYVVVAARIYLVRCYAKSVKTDLTANEKKQLRQIAAHLKGAQ